MTALLPVAQVHVPISGTTALRVPSNGNVIEVLRSLGSYGTFLLALEVSSMATLFVQDRQLWAALREPISAGFAAHTFSLVQVFKSGVGLVWVCWLDGSNSHHLYTH